MVLAKRMVRYNKTLRSSGEAAAPVRLRMWEAEVRDQFVMT